MSLWFPIFQVTKGLIYSWMLMWYLLKNGCLPWAAEAKHPVTQLAAPCSQCHMSHSLCSPGAALTHPNSALNETADPVTELCSQQDGKKTRNKKTDCGVNYSRLSEHLPILKSYSAINETMKKKTGNGTALSAKLIEVQKLIQNNFMGITGKYQE